MSCKKDNQNFKHWICILCRNQVGNQHLHLQIFSLSVSLLCICMCMLAFMQDWVLHFCHFFSMLTLDTFSVCPLKWITIFSSSFYYFIFFLWLVEFNFWLFHKICFHPMTGKNLSLWFHKSYYRTMQVSPHCCSKSCKGCWCGCVLWSQPEASIMAFCRQCQRRNFKYMGHCWYYKGGKASKLR